METLQIVWFALLAALLAAFMVCGGFDFGAGMLLCRMRPERREKAMAEIAPFWDGNQVWLVTAGGALFAAFPKAYSEILSNMYLPTVLFLAFLIFRAVSIEFFLASGGGAWRSFWARVCAVSSFASMFLFGMALGAVFGGEALCASKGDFGVLGHMVDAVPLAAGTLAVLFCLAHGSVFLALRENTFDTESFRTVRALLTLLSAAYLLYAVLFITCGRSYWIPKHIAGGVLLSAYLPLTAAMRLSRKKMSGLVFFMTSLFSFLCICAHALALFPYIAAPHESSAGISIYAASSSETTLKIMLCVALAGVPLAVAYFAYAHYVFSKRVVRGKLKGYSDIKS